MTSKPKSQRGHVFAASIWAARNVPARPGRLVDRTKNSSEQGAEKKKSFGCELGAVRVWSRKPRAP